MIIKTKAIEMMNEYGASRTPFIFIIDFEMNHPIVFKLEELDNYNILFDVNGIKNYTKPSYDKRRMLFNKLPLQYESYLSAFNAVMGNIRAGNTYLCNLTFPTQIEMNASLKEVFFISKAKYKLLYKNLFTVFSPECFVKITDGLIFSFPMKGTIDASIENAERLILKDEKELAEHTTIVDLIRNDLSIISSEVSVEKFRYVEKITTNQKNLLQVSSKIRGKLPQNFQSKLGEIIFSLLPAGSISGAPKRKTVEIIKEAENYNRGYYTGVFGIFDGKNLDSAVMIRFIEKINDKFFFKSGGGITFKSEPEKEYQELIDKVYVPII
jgi:para-aminobenzoate synthetase component 1